MLIQKFITEMVDNLTKKEIAKYKFFNKHNSNKLKDEIKLSDGTIVKKEPNNLDKISIFKHPYETIVNKEMEQFIGKPKFVEQGRYGYTTYVEPILKNVDDEINVSS